MKTFIFIILFSLSSFAEDNGPTQFFFQPQDGQHVVTPQVNFDHFIAEYESGTDVEFNDITLGVAYEYGIIENLSVGISASFSSSSLDVNGTSSTSSGANDLSFVLKSFTKLTPTVALRYGLGMSWSPEPSKIDGSGNSENKFSGRTEIDPYIGVDFRIAEKHLVGGRLSHSFLMGKEVIRSANGSESKSEGGESTTLNVFYEFNYNKYLFGGGLFYIETSDEKPDVGSSSERLNSFGYMIYANFFVSDSWTLVPQVLAVTTLDDEISGIKIDKYIGAGAIFSARYNF